MAGRAACLDRHFQESSPSRLDSFAFCEDDDAMHVISKKMLRRFWVKYPDAKRPLRRWFREVTAAEWESFAELRQTFGHADRVGKLIVFNAGGNKYRVIAAVHFNRGKLFVRNVLTHAEYDRGDWKEE
jgi:mRNA interferase HigB